MTRASDDIGLDLHGEDEHSNWQYWTNDGFDSVLVGEI